MWTIMCTEYFLTKVVFPVALPIPPLGKIPSVVKEESQVKLAWTSDLSMKVVFPDGSSDSIALSPSSNIPGEPTPCLFSGILDGDQDSLVSVSGCRNEDEISVTIVSRLNFPTWREDDGLAVPN